MSLSSAPYPQLAEDEHLIRAQERRDRAMAFITPDDVLCMVDDLIKAEPDPRRHPLYQLTVHALQYGTTHSAGKRPYMLELVGASYEQLLDVAIEQLVDGYLGSDEGIA